MFNWLGQDLTGRRTLDLYCGTGALSLEALSRGAALAVAVDRNPTLARAVETVAASFGAAGLEAHVADAEAFLSRESRAFDVVFLDPPFGSDPWPWLLPRSVAGEGEATWIVADYLDVVLHVFTPDARDFYRLDDLWGDVPHEVVEAASA